MLSVWRLLCRVAAKPLGRGVDPGSLLTGSVTSGKLLSLSVPGASPVVFVRVQ